ncbi:MAG: motility protein A [Nitrospinota bacterium]
MDIATILGLVSALGLVTVAIMSGGGLGLFINIPSVMIVVGGTIGASLISYSLKDILGSIGVAMNAFFAKVPPAQSMIPRFLELASTARKDGLLALEGAAQDAGDAFFAKGLQLVVDGVAPESIEEILGTEVDYLRERHRLGADIFSSMGAYSPAMGLIGTLIGLVQMLANMSDPSNIGPAMAVALLTTFYGALLANIIFIPLAGKLRLRSSEEVQVREIMTEGILSISNGVNPRIVEQRLHAFLPPKYRTEAA